MYLHGDRENFRDIIEQVSNESGRTPIVVEKRLLCDFNIETPVGTIGQLCL